MRRLFTLLMYVATLSAPEAVYAEEVTRIPVRIHHDRGEYRCQAEVAKTAEEQERGLMYRASLAADTGMLFVFHEARVVTMWMKNTPVSLDMIFIGKDGRISRIVPSTTPFSEQLISSVLPVVTVLELPGKTAEKHGLSVGNLVDYPPE